VQQGKNEIERITVVGTPARYNHVTEKGETIEAESESMVYTASENKLVMTKNASLKQPDHQVSSNKIIYDTLKKIVIAGDITPPSNDSAPDEKERVNITLTPKKQDQPASQTEK
jgi:lipopolysaccharide transport protein LptA